MKDKIIKLLPYICSAMIGLILAIIGVEMDLKTLALNMVFLILVIIVQLSVFVIVHELSHGFIAERNGLNFTVLYIGPFVFKRENKRFRIIKGLTGQSTYLGRVQIDNFEIIDNQDIEKAKKRGLGLLKQVH